MRYVAFVRNVMVGRQGLDRVKLLQVFSAAGGIEPVSHLATGNVSFACDIAPTRVAEAAQRRIADIIGRNEAVFVRSLTTLQRRVAGRPFVAAPWPDAHERCVSFTTADVRHLKLPHMSARKDACLFARVSSDVYSLTRLRAGRPGAPGKELERLLGKPVTTRNWNTIERIVAAHAASGGDC